MSDHQSTSKCLFNSVESIPAVIGEEPWSSFLGEVGQRNDNVRVVVDELLVEIGKTQEGLDVPDFASFGPVLDDLDFCGIHCKTIWR